MSFSNRLHHSALRGFVGTVLCAAIIHPVFAQTVGGDAADQPRSEKAQQQPKADNTPLKLEAIQHAIERLGTALEAQNDKEAAERKEKHEADDLKAQWEQAKWAEWVVYVGWAGVGLTLFGLVMIYGTLRYTRAAALSAVAAADIAGKTLIATQNNVLMQLRAYIWIEKAWITFDRRDAPVAHVYIKNFGHTPAKDVRWWVHIWIERHPLRVPLPRPGESFLMSSTVLPPGGTLWRDMPKEPVVALNEVELLGTSEGTIYVYGEVRYYDIEGNERVSEFRMIHGGGEPTAPQGLKPDHSGNKIT